MMILHQKIAPPPAFLNDFTDSLVRFEAQLTCTFSTSALRDAFTPERNVPLTIFRLPGVSMLSRSFLRAFTADFVRFEGQLR